MDIGFDPNKSDKNNRERGLPFELVADLDREHAVASEDTRREYGETRMVALVPMKGRLYVVCYTQRHKVPRIISFRKAN